MPTVIIAGGGTGGHLMPALAIAERLRALHPDIEPVLVGAARGVERDILPQRNFRYHLLPAEPIYRRQWWRNFRWPIVLWRLMRDVRTVLERENPIAVLGTGGYAAAPLVWAATRRDIPCAIQEQNAFPGIATRRLARRVSHLYLGVPEIRDALPPLPHARLFDTGNPIIPPDRDRAAGARARFRLEPGRPVILVTGGSQGALAINRAVKEVLAAGGFPGIQLIWVTGRGTHARFVEWHHPPEVTVVDFLDPMADAYAVADLVVGRAGATTLAEICAWGLPSVLIPLPTAAADHQTHNAMAMASADAAILLPQPALTNGVLRQTIGDLLADRPRLGRLAGAAAARARPDAADRIVSHFSTLWSGGLSFATYGESVN